MSDEPEGMLAVDFRLPNPRPLKREFRFKELIRKGKMSGPLEGGKRETGKKK